MRGKNYKIFLYDFFLVNLSPSCLPFSLTHSCTHSRTHSLTLSLTNCLSLSLSLNLSPSHLPLSLTHARTHSHTHSLSDSLSPSSTDWAQVGQNHWPGESAQEVSVHSEAGGVLEAEAAVSQWSPTAPEDAGQQPWPENGHSKLTA